MGEWRKARKKPVIVEFREVKPLLNFYEGKKGERIETREGKLIAIAGEDFIIRGVEGELYPISKQIFYKTYQVLENDRGKEKCLK